jgi:hypothetical protein
MSQRLAIPDEGPPVDPEEGSEITARGFDEDLHFILVEITGDEMHFQTISRAGKTVDAGSFKRPPEPRAS